MNHDPLVLPPLQVLESLHYRRDAYFLLNVCSEQEQVVNFVLKLFVGFTSLRALQGSLTPSSLPALRPPPIQGLEAEQLADRQQDKENTVCARLVGCFFIELHVQPNLFSNKACEEFVNWITSLSQSPGVEQHLVVFQIGKLSARNSSVCVFNPVSLTRCLQSFSSSDA